MQFTVEERETKEADPAMYVGVGHDLSHIFVLKRFNMIKNLQVDLRLMKNLP